jgi:predicted dehydrogenase
MKRFLVIGFGGAGQREKNIVECLFPTCEIAVWNTGKLPVPLPEHIVKIECIEEALAFKPEGVFIATPTSTHIDFAELLLNKVQFILIDKPLDSSLNRCEVFARNCRSSNTKIYLNFQRRFLACWQTLRNCILNKQDGEFLYGIIQIGSYYPEWRPHKKASDIYTARADLGGGVLLTECHELDLLQWILGKFVVRVTSQFQKIKNKNGTESNAQLLLNIEMDYGVRTVCVTLDYLSAENVRKMELCFENATYVVDENAGTVNRLIKGGENEHLIISTNKSYNPHESLIRAIVNKEYDNGEEIDLPLLTDGLTVNAIVHAAKISPKNNSWESVTTSLCPSEGVLYMERAIQRLQDTFQERLIAIYGLGSIGYGGYVDGWSDFDLDVLIETTYENARSDYETGKMIEKEIQQLGFERFDIRVYDIDHLNARKTILTFGQCSRACMLCDTAILLAGRDVRPTINRPSRDELSKEAIGLLQSILEKQDDWWESLPWEDIAAHFSLAARFLYTQITGQIAGKQKALEYFIEKKAPLFSNDILRWVLWALSCRLYYHPLLIRDVLHNEAVHALRGLFSKTLDILESEAII